MLDVSYKRKSNKLVPVYSSNCNAVDTFSNFRVVPIYLQLINLLIIKIVDCFSSPLYFVFPT